MSHMSYMLIKCLIQRYTHYMYMRSVLLSYYPECLECPGTAAFSPGPPMSSRHRGDAEENRAIS